MSKLTGLHSIFRKKSINGANIGFHTWTFARSLGRWRCLKPRTTDLVVIERHLISQVYMNEVLKSVVLPFCVETSDSTRPRMTMPEHTSLGSAKNNGVCIDRSLCSSDMSTGVQHNWASTRENLSSGVCEQHRRRPAYASAQSDQRLCYSRIGKYYM